jgi:hypothetical protein
MFRLLVAFLILSASVCVEAETFILTANERVYACESKSDVIEMFGQIVDTDYIDALKSVNTFENQACPLVGLLSTLMQGEVVREEYGNYVRGHDRVAIVRWSKKDGGTYYTSLIRSEFGYWSDLISFTLSEHVSRLLNRF